MNAEMKQIDPAARRLLDEFVERVARLEPHPASANISRAVSRFGEKVMSLSRADLAQYLRDKDLPPG